ncbi:Polyisoprenoid-binding protein YceI [Mariprofundus aestuarium]|uniref:Polyisoprenoid-binding protein YceI n=1 Tax=Mariprofundus aestuarium TaxID=1921086 RepID=A0A2K8KVH7_MARES|nr:YceI family protein [Mariprofundus aestuarium]ATX78818.1 Polyisoprenoid-binding protein YceI [Mariprofundus aestuarium]
MKKLWILLFMLLPATAWAGEWTLDGSGSDINFVSLKKGAVAEVHHFTRLSGSVKGKSAMVAIDLASVESGIDIRNKRMKSMLFEVGRFASAAITADLATIDFHALKAGESLTTAVPVVLDLHGVSKEFSVLLSVTTLAGDKLLVSSREPVIVKASDFGLAGGIEALREVAKLPSIAQAVPVSFHLQFIRRR